VAGLSVYNFDVALDGFGVIELPGHDPETRRITPSADLTAPVPSAGLFINYAFFKGFLLRLNAQFFDLDFQDLSGRLVESKLMVEFYPWRHVGFGGGWNSTDINVRDSGGSNPWKADYRYVGVLFYVAGVF